VAEVFINYRTGDGDEAAEFLAARLSDRFGKEHVFKASHSIRPGELFPKALIDAARKSDVLLAVMGPDWGAAPQLREEGDWVRMEILAAQASGIKVVPVIKGRKTDRLDRASLPPELMWLADVHSLRLDMHESTDDLKRIGDFLADQVPTLKAADQTAEEVTASEFTDNSARDVAGNLVQGRDISGGVRSFNLRNATGPAMFGDGNTQHNLNLIAAGLKRLYGGRGRVLNSTVALFVLAMILNGLIMFGVEPALQQVMVGAVLVTIVVVDTRIHRERR